LAIGTDPGTKKYVSYEDVLAACYRRVDTSSIVVNSGEMTKFTVKNKFSDDLLFKENQSGGLPQTLSRSTDWFMRNNLIAIHNPNTATTPYLEPVTSVALMTALKSNFITIRMKYHYAVKGLSA